MKVSNMPVENVEIGDIVFVRAGGYSAQSRCAALVTLVRDDSKVDLSVFPGDGVVPFTIKSVKEMDAKYREVSNKEIFWHRRADRRDAGSGGIT